MGEVHIIGQILGTVDFEKNNLFCKWEIQTGNGWKILSGVSEGQSSVNRSLYGEKTHWGFPIDLHYTTKTIQGWPKLNIQVFQLDQYNRVHSLGYGQSYLPTSPGSHTQNCYIWRPLGTLTERITQFFIGGSPQLSGFDKISDRHMLNTESMGIVVLEIGMIFRNLKEFGVEY